MKRGLPNFEERPVEADFPSKPPYAILWRGLGQLVNGMHSEYAKAKANADNAHTALSHVADAIFQARKSESSPDSPSEPFLLQIDNILSNAKVEIEIPRKGTSYEGDLMDRFDNIAQINCSVGCAESELQIAEIVSPAVTINGEPVRVGKAIIAVINLLECDEEAAEREEGN